MYICRKSFLDYPEISLLAKSEVQSYQRYYSPLAVSAKLRIILLIIMTDKSVIIISLSAESSCKSNKLILWIFQETLC